LSKNAFWCILILVKNYYFRLCKDVFGRVLLMESNTIYEKGAHARITPILIEEELKTSFLDYAMSVVVSRALPDVRDGLKPVHRRILYTMHQLGFTYNKPYHKSVRVVGEVLGKYHPHGDQAVYNTMVGMVQEFSKRYPLLDGQGNWGSIDGDNAAAMRYTEVRMEKITQELLADLDKETVYFVPNFDESTTEPVILPSRLPNLLINGTSGIAVGMATSIPPHNLAEIIDACLVLLNDEFISDEKLCTLVQGPDFPTGGIICGRAGIVKAYTTGRGTVIVRGVTDIEETKKGTLLVISELPYQVNKAELIIKIAELVKNKVIEGISNIRDESDKRGIRVVIEIKRGENAQVVLNQLYKHTQLQTSIGILMLALHDNRPLVFTLRQLIKEYLTHREIVIIKRTEYDLAKAQAREHILLGLGIALGAIDDVVALIKQSQSSEEAIKLLNKRFLLTPEQSKAILEMRLQRLTSFEQDKMYQELEEVKKAIASYKALLSDRVLLKQEITKELLDIKAQYGDERRTRIEGPLDILSEADLVPDDEMVVTLTRKGYIKRVPLSLYDVQRRGGKGKMGMAALDEAQDILQDIFVARNHDELLFFTNLGRIYSLSVFQVPEGSRTAKGRAIINLLSLAPGEYVVKLLCTRDFDNKYLVMVTKKGTIKRTQATAFSKIRSSGIRAITLHDDDELVFCSLSSGDNYIVLVTRLGQGIRFNETEVRAMGRIAAGVRGMKLREGDEVVGMEVVSDDQYILFATEYGYGKRVRVGDFRATHRGGYGVRAATASEKTGAIIGLVVVDDNTHVLLIDTLGKIIRVSPTEVRAMRRQAQGVRLIRLEDSRKLAAIAAIPDVSEEPGLESQKLDPADHACATASEFARDTLEGKTHETTPEA
jgi:DNA gyrase subunit A